MTGAGSESAGNGDERATATRGQRRCAGDGGARVTGCGWLQPAAAHRLQARLEPGSRAEAVEQVVHPALDGTRMGA